ncbi:MAG: radical SAM protein [Candidatus Omnitrophica bacterium]|nr:radical SAM protein [Candidatus Omnitrophota bacterium]
MRNILLVNPWIYDFAAYDLWLKPWGLLKISAVLKEKGLRLFMVDTTDRHHPGLDERPRDHMDGTGKFREEEIEKPGILEKIPRKYKRYGLSVEAFLGALPEEDIDLILLSSGMTYWYPGVFEAVRLLRMEYPGVAIALGGTYATLEYEHARLNSGADIVISNSELDKLSELLGGGYDLSFQNLLDKTIDYDWYPRSAYAVLRLSLGCPFDCAYCAQKRLGPSFMLKEEQAAISEFSALYERGIRNFAFYDDALLFAGDYLVQYLERITSSGLDARFYTPNGLHARFMSQRKADLMKKAGFVNPTLSLEIADPDKARSWHNKVTVEELRKAIGSLRKAGYRKGRYTVYLMLGMPGTSISDVKRSVDLVHSLGAKVSLSEYSPVPGSTKTPCFTADEKDPLYQNNSIFPTFCASEWGQVKKIKEYTRQLNTKLLSGKNTHDIPA